MPSSQTTIANGKATAEAGKEESKDFLEQLRTVHFTLLA